MKRASTWFIIIGIIIISIPFLGRIYTNHVQQQMYDEYLAQLEAIEATDILEASFDDSVTTEEAIAAEEIKPTIIENVIGRILIPSIASDQLLIEGSTTKQLRYGAGHVTGTALPGEVGNCSIAAHRNYTFGSYFNRLDEVKVGDAVSITYNKQNFSYEVYESFVVLPDEVSVLAAPEDDTIITLITCHPKGSNTHRLIVRARIK